MIVGTSLNGLMAVAMAALAFGILVQDAWAGSRSYTPRSSYVPRSSTTGVSPGTFGRSDPLQGRIERDRLQIERFQDRSRALSRQREVIRQQRDATRPRASSPGNRLTDRLRPTVEPLGNLPEQTIRPEDQALFTQPPRRAPSGDAGSGGSADFGLHPRVSPFHYLDRNMR